GGFVETGNQRLTVTNKLPITSAEDMAQVVVEEREGQPALRLGDVAEVKYGDPPLIGEAVINGGPGLMLIVEKLPWANTLDVTKGVEAALRDLKPGLGDMVVDSKIFRPADFISTALHNLGRALVLGSLLMVIMLFFFLWDWCAAPSSTPPSSRWWRLCPSSSSAGCRAPSSGRSCCRTCWLSWRRWPWP